MICEESSTGIIGIPEREIRENEEEAIFEDNGRDFWKKNNENRLQIHDTLSMSNKVKKERG